MCDVRVSGRPVGTRTRSCAVRAVVVLAALCLLPANVATGASFPVSQEQVLVGSSTGPQFAEFQDGVHEVLTEVDVAADPIAFAAAETIAIGNRTSGTFPSGLQASDNSTLVYREGYAVRTVVTGFAAGGNVTPCAWSSCGAGIISDNASASSSADSDTATYRGFGASLPAGASNITVEVGYEAYEPGGNDRLAITVSWDGGGTFCSNAQLVNVPAADPDAYSYANLTLCSGHNWSPADFTGDNLHVLFTHVRVGGADETVFLDAHVLRVTYREPTDSRHEVHFGWAGVPAGQDYTLTVEASVSDENATLEVLSPPASWTPRLTISAPTDQTLTYRFTTSEFNAGAPAIRFVDASGPDATPSNLSVDFLGLTVTVLAYALDVRQNISGIAGMGPGLTIMGNANGSENFRVYVWNVPAGVWDLKLDSAFGPADGYHNLTLGPEHIAVDVVRIRFADAALANSAAGRLELDLVAVVSAPPPGSPDVVLIAGIAGGGVGLALTLLVAVRHRKGAPVPVPGLRRGGLRRVLPGVGRRASVLTGPEVATALGSGESYVVEGASPAYSLKILEDLTRIGRSALFLTGRDPRTASNGFRLRRTRLVRVSHTDIPPGPDTLAPSLETLYTKIDEFLRTNPVGVVLIEGADFLTERNKPREVSRFLLRVAATVSRGQQIFLVAMSPDALRTGGLKPVVRGLPIVRAA